MKTSDIVPISLSRRELYDLVWAAPIPEAAARLGISRTWLTKICHRAGVPYPTRAYWSLLAAGKRPARDRLGHPRDREEVIILRPRGRALPRPGEAAERAESAERADRADRLTRLHPVVTAWRVEIWHEQERLRREPWRKQGPAAVELGRRRLRLLDRLLKALSRLGHRVESGGAAGGRLCLAIDSRRVEIVLRDGGLHLAGAAEAAEAAALEAKPWLAPPPIAMLSFEVRAEAETLGFGHWEDRPGVELEDQLDDIVAAISRMARAPRSEDGETGEAGIAADLAEPIGPEELQWLALRRIAADWDAADRVRRLLDRLAARAAADGPPLSAGQKRWLDWARTLTARLEARTAGLDEVIAKVDAAGGAVASEAPPQQGVAEAQGAQRSRSR